jgi:zinc transport system substrate-binding protein
MKKHTADVCAGVLVLWVALSLAACSKTEQPGPPEKAGGDSERPTVYVVNYPLMYFAERIAGDSVKVVFPAPPEEDPAFWKPAPENIVAYQGADVILLNGATYAKWVAKVSLPESKLVDTSASFRDQLIKREDKVTHAHGPGGKHAHGDTAFTTWLDPKLAVEHARAIKDALVRLLPGRREIYEKGFASLEADLLGLDAQIAKIVSVNSNQPLIGSHPVYQYFARRYALNLRAVHWEPDEAPDATMWKEFEELLAEHAATWMLWEGEPIPESVEKLDGLGVRSLVFEPCGNRPEDGDYLSAMRSNSENLRKAFGP